jgi:hypothetical protein
VVVVPATAEVVGVVAAAVTAEVVVAAAVGVVVAAADTAAAAIATASFLLQTDLSTKTDCHPERSSVPLVFPAAFRRARGTALHRMVQGAAEGSLFASAPSHATAPRCLAPGASSEDFPARATACGSPASTCPPR